MKLQFLGANRQVTGSRYGLSVGDATVLIDCGMFQERKYLGRNWEQSPIPAEKIDAIVLTHAHIDHCGLLPRLVQQGFQGTIYTTRPTVDLTEIMLRDAAKIQVEDAKYKRKRHLREGRKGKYPVEPLFVEEDALKCIKLFRGVPYERNQEIVPGLDVTFREAGHILGSASLKFTARTSEGKECTLVFSGDIGQWGKPLIRDPSPPHDADFLVMESTYGDRRHTDGGDIQEQLANVINSTFERGGAVVVPTFAVERAQELMYHIGGLVHDARIPKSQIFLDSPMAVDVTEVFHSHRDSYDDETWELIKSGVPPLRFPGLRLVRKAADSKAINNVNGRKIILSTSGMCTAGRIKHHLRQNIRDRNATILFVGYQGRGTLGRQILEGTSEVRIHGQYYDVRARIAQIFGFSGHADRDALMRWADSYRQAPQRVFLTHGEEDSATCLAEALREAKGWRVDVPAYREEVELLAR